MTKKAEPDRKQGYITENGKVYDLEALMRTYGNDVLRMAYCYVKDYEAAEDIFQEVFIKVNAKADSFRGESTIKTWLLRITVNACKDYLKSAYRQRVTILSEEEEIKIPAADTIEKIEQKQDMKWVREALLKLPENYREVLVCLYFEERSVAETAKVLGISEGTVKSRLSRGRERFRKILEEEKGGAYNG
ncbi:MAG: sigma-70 family RNA polymerase sigma factor [Lachnospiraceae bacterium]|nr:sigma-70 family RNA polymerase sigma factor [Lachnospiraceae bacterium]